MSNAAIVKGALEIGAFVGVVAFTITVIVPCIFAARTDDEEFLNKVQQILEEYRKDTLRPLCLMIAVVIVAVCLLAGWR